MDIPQNILATAFLALVILVPLVAWLIAWHRLDDQEQTIVSKVLASVFVSLLVGCLLIPAIYLVVFSFLGFEREDWSWPLALSGTVTAFSFMVQHMAEQLKRD